MIVITLPSKQTPVSSVTQFPITQSRSHKPQNISTLFLKRNGIVMKAAALCSFKEGDLVTPVDAADVEKYGEVWKVEGIARNITQYGYKDWPKDDTPLIVTIYCEKTEKRMFCTASWIKLCV